MDRVHLTRMCEALQESLDRARSEAWGDRPGDSPGEADQGPVGCPVAAAIDRSLTSLRADLDGHRIDREAARVRLRRLVALAGAVRSGDLAQSPASDPTRPIVDADPWDYRRDRHRDGDRWERQWIERIAGSTSLGSNPHGSTSFGLGLAQPEMAQPDLAPRDVAPRDPIDPCRPAPLRRALLTSCGMAAMTTVLALVERSTGDGPIVVDRATYHETRHLLATGALARRVHEVATDDVADAITTLGATAVVVDAVSNSADVRLVDLDRISHALDQVTGGPAPLLLVDASVCSTAAGPVRRLLTRSGPTHRTVVIESLTKHAQLGLDRVAAGVIVADDGDATLLDGLREHLGTNIADLTCLQLLPPDPTLLDARLRRIDRNAGLVAERLAAVGVPVVHPSRADHPDHTRWLADRPSCGLLTLPLEAGPPDLLDRWRERALDQEVPLDHGAGFGFDTTRVYRTSATVPQARCFVRIAPGTEPIDTMVAVAEVLASPWT